jgi:signal transduction histidine kinase
MNRGRDSLMPIGAVVLIAAVAFVTLALVNSARDKGLSALEKAKTAEIGASADSRDQQIVGILTSTTALAAQPWDFAPASPNDLRILNSYRSPDARTGFFLIDPSDRVTQGILLRDGVVATKYDHTGFAAAKSSRSYLAGQGQILPVGTGLTTEVPVFVLSLPVIDRTTGAYRGSFIAEVDVSPESSFNREISQLVHGRTDQVLIVDSAGVVLAANRNDLLAKPLDGRAATVRDGFHRVDDEVVVRAAIPSAGWSLVFREEASEFDHALSQPLQNAARVVVVLLLLVGLGVFVLLFRRLRAAHEEQARLRRLNEDQEEFISIVSHELRTPVSGILGFLQTALDHWEVMDDAERRGAMRRAATNARRLQALTRDVLDTESVEAGRLAFNFEPTELVDEVRSAVEAAEALYDDHLITFELPVPPVTANVDADRIQQVLTNLLDNAAKNSPPGSTIQVRLVAEDGKATVSVVDAGSGLDPELGERLFEKFIRGRGSSVSGTGLGLYVCRLVIEAHHGTISAGPNPEGGTRFTFDLPMTAAPVGV